MKKILVTSNLIARINDDDSTSEFQVSELSEGNKTKHSDLFSAVEDFMPNKTDYILKQFVALITITELEQVVYFFNKIIDPFSSDIAGNDFTLISQIVYTDFKSMVEGL